MPTDTKLTPAHVEIPGGEDPDPNAPGNRQIIIPSDGKDSLTEDEQRKMFDRIARESRPDETREEEPDTLGAQPEADEPDDEAEPEETDETTTEEPDAPEDDGISELRQELGRLINPKIVEGMDRDEALKTGIRWTRTREHVKQLEEENAALREKLETRDPEPAGGAQTRPAIEPDLKAATTSLREGLAKSLDLDPEQLSDLDDAFAALVTTAQSPLQRELAETKQAIADSATKQYEPVARAAESEVRERFPILQDDEVFAQVRDTAKEIAGLPIFSTRDGEDAGAVIQRLLTESARLVCGSSLKEKQSAASNGKAPAKPKQSVQAPGRKSKAGVKISGMERDRAAMEVIRQGGSVQDAERAWRRGH